MKWTTESIKRVLDNFNIKRCLKATPSHWQLIFLTWRSCFKRSNTRYNLFHSQQVLRKTSHRGDQTEIQYLGQRTPRLPKKSVLARTLFTISSRYLLEVDYYEPTQVGKTDASDRLRKLTCAKVYSTVRTACTCPKSAEHGLYWIRTTMGDKIVETLGSKIRFLNVLVRFSTLPPSKRYWLFYFFSCTDHRAYTINIELGGRGYQRINARCKWNRTNA